MTGVRRFNQGDALNETRNVTTILALVQCGGLRRETRGPNSKISIKTAFLFQESRLRTREEKSKKPNEIEFNLQTITCHSLITQEQAYHS